MGNLARLACRSASAEPGVAHLSIASDVQEADLAQAKRSKRNKAAHTPNRWFEGSRARLNWRGRRKSSTGPPKSQSGRGALGARADMEQTACSPRRWPRRCSAQQALARCDALLIVGSTFTYIEYYPHPNNARGVQVDRNAQRIGLCYPVESRLVGNAAETLRLLNGKLTRKSDRSFLEQVQREMDRWREMMPKRQARPTPR